MSQLSPRWLDLNNCYLHLSTVTLLPLFQVAVSTFLPSIQILGVWHVGEAHPSTRLQILLQLFPVALVEHLGEWMPECRKTSWQIEARVQSTKNEQMPICTCMCSLLIWTFSIFGGNASHKRRYSVETILLKTAEPQRGRAWGNRGCGLKWMCSAIIFTWLKYESCCRSSSKMSFRILVVSRVILTSLFSRSQLLFPFQTLVFSVLLKAIFWRQQATDLFSYLLGWKHNPITVPFNKISDQFFPEVTLFPLFTTLLHVIFSGRRFRNPVNYISISCATQQWYHHKHLCAKVTNHNMFWSPFISLCLLAIARQFRFWRRMHVCALNLLWSDGLLGRTQGEAQTQRWRPETVFQEKR